MKVIKFVSAVAVTLTLSTSAFAQVAQDMGPNARTVVKCTQNSAPTNNRRYNVHIVQMPNGSLIADLHAVDTRTNYGRSIYTTNVRSQVVSTNPLTVTFWNENNSFILKVAAHYARGNSIIDYNGPGLAQLAGVNVYMNCYSAQQVRN